MRHEDDITFRIHIDNRDRILPRDIETVFDSLEHALYLSDRDEIERICKSIKIPEVYRDAALERLRKYRGRRIVVDRVSEGSFIFDTLLIGVPLYILHKVIGEPINEGISKTESRKLLVDYVKRNIDEKALSIVMKLEMSPLLRKAKITRDGRTVVIHLTEGLSEESLAKPLSYYLDNPEELPK